MQVLERLGSGISTFWSSVSNIYYDHDVMPSECHVNDMCNACTCTA